MSKAVSGDFCVHFVILHFINKTSRQNQQMTDMMFPSLQVVKKRGLQNDDNGTKDPAEFHCRD
ncbi:hypothetical protein KAI36_01704 [Paenibacillus sp. S02]|nr:hypothetical protein KAI36_01704 [Paenibacillus sp. S02]